MRALEETAVSYSKDVGEVSARFRSAGQVPSVTYPSGTHVRFTAPGSTTSGQYGLFEWNMTQARGGADPHFHKTFSESFYVMEGVVRLFNGDAWIDAEKVISSTFHRAGYMPSPTRAVLQPECSSSSLPPLPAKSTSGNSARSARPAAL
jgi:hypothetical protein